MQLYLLREVELRKLSLPRKVSGQYTLEHLEENGESRPLLRVNARSDGWYIAENSRLQISGGEGRQDGAFREFPLRENALYYLRKDHSENMVLLVEPDRANRGTFSCYRVPEGGVITVGRADFNRICFDHPFVNANRHLQITYESSGAIRVMDCEEAVSEHRKSPGYLNTTRIDTELKAQYGDVIFLFGLKIVLGPGFIAVNNPDDQVVVHLERRDYVPFVPTAESEEENDVPAQGYFSSAPRARREVIYRRFQVEKPPEGLREPDTPWIVMLGPSLTMAMGSLFSSVITINNILSTSGSVNSALPSLVTSIVMVMGSAVWPIVGRRVQKRSQIRRAAIASDDYEDYLKQLAQAVEAATLQQKQVLEENNPLLKDCVRMIEESSETLWERSQRHKDFLEVMIGRGDVPLNAEFSYPERGYHSEISQSARDMYALVAGEHLVKDVPITIPLRGAGIVGVIGDRPKIISFTRALLLELTSMHNYEDLKIVFIYNEKEREIWNFVKWIPHLWNNERSVRYLANDPEEVRNISDYISRLRTVKTDPQQGASADSYYLIFAADRVLAERAQAIKELYRSPDTVNMTMIALYDERQHLPKACSYVIDLTHDADRARNPDKYQGVAVTLADYNDITGRSIVCRERIGYDGDLEELFVRMSNIHLDSPATTRQLPTQLTFMEMYALGKPEHLDLTRRWKEHDAVTTLAASIGIDADAYPITLDIHEKAHGPHGVIAGMTGSGKSEFIISYLASLAVNYSPEDVAFVLIDFKGGGMADIFKNLPHTAGLITNLDGNELRRSFLAIEHELEKRQKLFKEISEQKKISNIDIYKYQKLRKADSTLRPLPHLVIVSDEFAELKQQHGDFMAQLIRIARIGRSLGVHLILATQKPDGVVDEQIKSNIRFKICLKVQDKSDSQGMIGRPDATLITNPGRFYLQVGNDEVFEYGQSPWSGALYEPMEHAQKREQDYIEVLDEQGLVLCRSALPRGPRDPRLPEKQIDALVEFIRKTADENGMRAEKLWLNPIPGPKAEKKREAVHETEIRPFVLNPTVGTYDDLLNQKHLPLTVPFTTQGNALLYGTSDSGELEFLNCVLVRLLEHHSAEELNLYLCDYDAGALSAFEDAPHTKTVVCAGDSTGAEELLSELTYQMTERRELLRRYGGSYQNFIQSSGETLPSLLLVVHNYQNLYDDYADARPKLLQLAREGVKYGIYLLLTGTTGNSIPYSMLPLFRNIYTLRQNSDDQYREILGKTEGITPEPYCGRGLVRVDGVVCEFQTEMVFEDAENRFEAIQTFCRGLSSVKRTAAQPDLQRPVDLNDRSYKTEIKQPGTAALHQTPRQWTADLAYSPDSVPVAADIPSGEPITFDFTAKAATVLVYDDAHKRDRDSVLSAFRRACPNLHPLEGNPEEVEASIDALWEEMLRRAKEGGEAKRQGLPLPAFKPLYFHLKNPSQLTPNLPDTPRVRLAKLVEKLTPNYRIHFLIEENSEHLDMMMAGICLEAALPFSQGIVLTTDVTAYVLFEEGIAFEGKARKGRGFLVSSAQATLADIPEQKGGLPT